MSGVVFTKQIGSRFYFVRHQIQALPNIGT